jgi:XTP/dITP diphosphohydrolase
MRRYQGERLIVATHNKGKLAEFASLLSPYVNNMVSCADLGLPEPEETGATFAENAILKAQAAAKAADMLALADDSGLCVTALKGEPGIHSARWGGPERDMNAAMTRVNTELGSIKDRSAYFICVLALAWPDNHVETVEGRIYGTLVWPTRGDMGHGYDPMFVPKGLETTFAEMKPAAKDAISHRGRAVKELIKRYFA